MTIKPLRLRSGPHFQSPFQCQSPSQCISLGTPTDGPQARASRDNVLLTSCGPTSAGQTTKSVHLPPTDLGYSSREDLEDGSNMILLSDANLLVHRFPSTVDAIQEELGSDSLTTEDGIGIAPRPNGMLYNNGLTALQ